MNCPVCGEALEPNYYEHGFHPVEYICPECGFETDLSETERLKLFIEKYEDAAWSSCNDEAQRFEYQMLANWLKQLLKIKELEDNIVNFCIDELGYHINDSGCAKEYHDEITTQIELLKLFGYEGMANKYSEQYKEAV